MKGAAHEVAERIAWSLLDEAPDLRLLFHRLNNQLGIILANAELLEAKATSDLGKARASQVVAGALAAMSTVKELRSLQNRFSDSEL